MATHNQEKQNANEVAKNTSATELGVAQQKEKTNKAALSVFREAETKSKEFESIYGKNPSQESILQKCKTTSDTFKDCAKYEDVIRIIKEGKNPTKNDLTGKDEDLYYWMTKNVLSPEKIEKESESFDFASVYGKNPTEASVLKTLKERQKDIYKDAKTYDEAMKILSTRRPPAHKWIKEHISPRHELQNADEIVDKKIKGATYNQKEIEESNALLDKELTERGYDPKNPDKKAEDTKKNAENIEKTKGAEKPTPKKETNSRWTEADEANRPGSQNIPKEEKKPKVPKEKKEKPKKEKKPRRGFWKTTGNIITWPFRTSVKLVKSAAKTVWTPVGLTSYLLADMPIKDKSKRNGWKDRWAGYKKIRKGEKKK